MLYLAALSRPLQKNGGRYWTRTSGLHNVNVMRYQLRQPPTGISLCPLVISQRAEGSQLSVDMTQKRAYVKLRETSVLVTRE
jgi:hypothetical protein